ncbi:MAG: hypothetical protein EI684_22250 [Candidatus Viridilinea halotolerans]|uniref:Uncharacterized protein n=1 Tax=Candidatus Viridilinea halotolerans TaxID=2491704 RepID=A0A426TQX9_9CHLR|nr:MAG: hypothetical protein EI684_22250 [Candidatus Viridilinea halotolerans]
MYRTLDQIIGRREEKVLPFLTIQQLAGAILAAIPGSAVSSWWSSGVVGTLVMIVMALVGYFVATDIDGSSTFDRLVSRGRAWMRNTLFAKNITPDEMPEHAVKVSGVAISWEDGVVAIHDDALAMTPDVAGEGVFPLPPPRT